MSKEETLSLVDKIIEEAKKLHRLPDNLSKAMAYRIQVQEAKFLNLKQGITTNQCLASELISIINLFPHTEENYHSKLKLFELGQKLHDLMPEDSEISQLQITMEHLLAEVYIRHNKFSDDELYHTLNKAIAFHRDPQIREKQLELELKSSNAFCRFHTHAGSHQAELEEIIQKLGQSIISKFLSLPSSESLISNHYINLAGNVLSILSFYLDLYLESKSAIHFTHAERILKQFERIQSCDNTYVTPYHQHSILILMNTYNRRYRTRIDNTDFWLSFFEIRRHFAVKTKSPDLTQSNSFLFPIKKVILEYLETVKEKLNITSQTIKRANLVMQNKGRTEEKIHPAVINLMKIEQLLPTAQLATLQSELLNMASESYYPLEDDDDFILIFKLLNTISELGRLIPNNLDSIKNIIKAADLKLRFYIDRKKAIPDDLVTILDEISVIRSNDREILIFEIDMMKSIYKKCLQYFNQAKPAEKNDLINAIHALSLKIMHLFAFSFFKSPTTIPPENKYLDIIINALSTAKFLLEQLSKKGAMKQTALDKVQKLVDYLKKFVFANKHPSTLTLAQRTMVQNIIFQIILKVIEKNKALLIENVETIDFLAIAQRLLGNGNPTDTIRQVMILLHSIQKNRTIENKSILLQVPQAGSPSTSSSSQVAVISTPAALPAPAPAPNTLAVADIILPALPQTAAGNSSSHTTEMKAAPPTRLSKKARRKHKLAQKKQMQSAPPPLPAPEKVLKPLDEKKAELESELTRVKQDNQRMSEEITHTLELNRELQKQLDNTQRSLTNSRAQHKENHRVLKTQLSAAQGKIVEITQREKQHTEENCLLKSRLQQAQQEIAEVTQHQSQYLQENTTLKQASKINQEKAQQVAQQLKAQQRVTETQAQELKTQQHAAEIQAQAQAKRIAELEKQLLLTQKTAEASALEIQALQKKAIQSEKEIKALQTKVAQFPAKVHSVLVEERMKITNNIIKPLKEQLADKVAALAAVESYQRAGITPPQPPTQPVYVVSSWRPDLFGSNFSTASATYYPGEQSNCNY